MKATVCPSCGTRSVEIESKRRLQDRYPSGRSVLRHVFTCPDHGEFVKATAGVLWGNRRTHVIGNVSHHFSLYHQVSFQPWQSQNEQVLFVRQLRHQDRHAGLAELTTLTNEIEGRWLELEEALPMWRSGDLWDKAQVLRLSRREALLLSTSRQMINIGAGKSFDDIEELALSYLEANVDDALEAIGFYDMED